MFRRIKWDDLEARVEEMIPFRVHSNETFFEGINIRHVYPILNWMLKRQMDEGISFDTR